MYIRISCHLVKSFPILCTMLNWLIQLRWAPLTFPPSWATPRRRPAQPSWASAGAHPSWGLEDPIQPGEMETNSNTVNFVKVSLQNGENCSFAMKQIICIESHFESLFSKGATNYTQIQNPLYQYIKSQHTAKLQDTISHARPNRPTIDFDLAAIPQQAPIHPQPTFNINQHQQTSLHTTFLQQRNLKHCSPTPPISKKLFSLYFLLIH